MVIATDYHYKQLLNVRVILYGCPSAGSLQYPYHPQPTANSFSRQIFFRKNSLLQQLSESSSRLKPTNPLAVPFRALELLDNGFSRWLRWSGSLRDRVLVVLCTFLKQ